MKIFGVKRLKGVSAAALAFGAALALLLAPASPAAAVEEDEAEGSVQRAYPHVPGDQDKCSVCHKEDLKSLNLDPVTVCTRCHTGNVDNHPVTRHPMGKAARIRVPDALPLTKEGIIVCSTCHDPHNKGREKKMLRVEYRRLCASCHAGY